MKKVVIMGGWDKSRLGQTGTIVSHFTASKQSSAYCGITNAQIYRIVFEDEKIESFVRNDFNYL